MSQNFIVLDMFSGGGGLTEGFIRQSFDVIAHIEKDPNAVRTLHTRLLYHNLRDLNKSDLYSQYYKGEIPRDDFVNTALSNIDHKNLIIDQEINDLTRESMISTIKSELKAQYDRTNVDVIIGGPPCQAYSLVGRGKDKFSMRKDPRNYLYKHYLHFLKIFQPKIFVFENVPGMISAKNGTIYNNIINGCSKLGYHLDKEIQILNACNFGVLQNRKRVFFIGWKNDSKLNYPEFPSKRSEENINGIFKDLPMLHAGEGTDNFQPYADEKPSRYLISTKIRNGNEGIRHHQARIHNKIDKKIYKIAIKKWDQSRQRLHYDDLPEKLKTHEKRDIFRDRFKVVDGNSYSHAVLAHLGKDGHYFIHPDINQVRSLTVREAARIQSFPDDYLFEGPRLAKYVQIGNAVPPLMAEGIAGKIKEMLNEI
jgi:DNA (cytosine-5)-methyltransferase 1